MTPVIICLRVFGKGTKADGTEQTTAEFAAEARGVTQDISFIKEVFAFGQTQGLIAANEVCDV